MSLKNAKHFLQVLDKHFPITDEGDSKRHHAMMIEQDKILLMVHTGTNWQSFLLDDEDCNKASETIVTELKKLLIKE